MSRWYLDTSAALKLIIDEAESRPLGVAIDDAAPNLVSSWLLDTELRRAIQREVLLTQTLATDLLTNVDLYEVPPSLFRQAGLLPGSHLRSLDAIHLATAVRIGVDHVVTYDPRMISSAHLLGINVLSPA